MNKAIPSISTCLKLIDKYTMLGNIREHSITVARVAEAIHRHLQESCISKTLPGRDLIIAGALLHDIAKTKCLETGCDHAREGAEICIHEGYQQVADIVREHVRLFDFSPTRYEVHDFLAKELIYYADKRVVHDKIVSLSERLQYILERYGNNDPMRLSLIEKNFNQCETLEAFICRSAQCSSEQLVSKLSTQPFE